MLHLEALFKQVKADAPRAVDRFVKHFTPWLHGIAGRFPPKLVNVEDAIQNFWMRFFVALPAFQWRGEAQLRAWMVRTVRNMCLDLIRNGRRRLSPSPLSDDAQAIDPLSGAAEADVLNRAEMDRYLAILDPVERTIVILHVCEGRGFEEIAIIVELNPQKVRRVYIRALAKMRPPLP